MSAPEQMDEQLDGKIPNINVDTIGQRSRNVDGIGYVVHTLDQDQMQSGSSKTDVPTYKP